MIRKYCQILFKVPKVSGIHRKCSERVIRFSRIYIDIFTTLQILRGQKDRSTSFLGASKRQIYFFLILHAQKNISTFFQYYALGKTDLLFSKITPSERQIYFFLILHAHKDRSTSF